MKISDMEALDQAVNWHPCSQMKDYEIFKPMVIQEAFGSYIQLKEGRRLIDATSSWWCKSLGHRHPKLIQAVRNQLNDFEHVIYANTTYEKIIALSQKLTALVSHCQKVFYAGDGSCAVEIAMKMSLHARVNAGQINRKKFIAFKNGYHGETLGALSVSDLGLYRDPYRSICFEPIFITPLYVNDTSDTAWADAKDYWEEIQLYCEQVKHEVTAIIFEPILQGAGGMKMISADFLSRLCAWAKANGIHIIADEIMTGVGRTGKMLASNYANIKPDFVCLSKSLTGGWLPFSVVLTTDAIYQLFYDSYESGRSFLHSHTYCGNALGVSLALAVLEVIEKEQLCDRANQIQLIMRKNMEEVRQETGAIKNIRGIGALVAADLIVDHASERKGYAIFQTAVKMGAFLRPLGNTIYWMPPLNISVETLEELKNITIQAIAHSYS